MDNVTTSQINILSEIKQSNTYNQLVTQDNSSLNFEETFNLDQTFNEFNSLIQTFNNFNITVNETLSNLIEQAGKIDLTSQFIKGFDSLINKVKVFGDTVSAIIGPGISFEQSIADISASTGIAEDDLDKISQAARQTGKESGIGASEAANAFSILASEIPVENIGIDGLIELQKNSITLSQAAGITMDQAATALAGTISTFGIDSGEAGKVINVMAASSMYGSAGISELAESFKAAGAQSSIAGVSLEDTAGALEVLSKNNIKGAEAGTQLSVIIQGLQSVFGAELGDMTLTQALDQLKPKMEDAAFMSQVFGSESASAAKSLIQNASAVGEMAEKVSGTDTAFEQASIRTETTAQMMERCRSKVDDLKIGFFELTGNFGGYISIIGEYAGAISEIMPLFTSLGNAISFVTDAQKMQSLWTDICKGATMLWNSVQMIFNATLWANPITWVVMGIAALVAVIIICCTQVEGWGKQWKSIVNFMKLSGELFVESFKYQFESMINKIMMGIDKLKIGWYKFKNAVGLGDSDENDKMIAGLEKDIDNRKKEIKDGQVVIDGIKQQRDSSLNLELSKKATTTEEKNNGKNDNGINGFLENFGITKNAINAPQNINTATTTSTSIANTTAKTSATTIIPAIATTPATITSSAYQSSANKQVSNTKYSTNVAVTENNSNKEQKEAAPDIKGNTNYAAIVASIAPFKSNAMLEATKVSETQEKLTETNKIFNTQFQAGDTQALFVGEENSSINTGDTNNINNLTSNPAKQLVPKTSFFKAASIATAAMLLPGTAAATTTPMFGEESATVQTELYSGGQNGQGISMSKFCDTIEIHIANADDKGYRQIEEEVCQTLMKVFDNYGA